jgi:hypothetical protein
MSTPINDGGPAFPAKHYDLTDDEHGMTLRDYFAASAPPQYSSPKERWEYADAMLSERSKAK